MMHLSNNSSSSLCSTKDKKLPPIPSTPIESMHFTTGSPLAAYPTIVEPDSGILQSKTLKRKNFKKLSLNASPEAKLDADNSSSKFEGSSLRQNRINVRPAPLLNLKSKDNQPSHSGYIISQTVDYKKPDKIDVKQTNKHLDPDQQSSTNLIINQISNLELSTASLNQHVTPLNRKRQTVISSISPTKSSESSPLEPNNRVNNLVDKSMILQNSSMSPIATTSSFTLNNDDLVTLKNLGSGNSGTVCKILHVPTQKTMAKKTIHIDLKTVIQTQIIRELRILHECQSPYIIEFYGAFLNTNNTIVICMEYCNCGSLDRILPLCHNKQFPLFVLKKLAFSILSGLSYLYTAHKIIHRDIKPSNVLMTHKGEFKLCDFGVSRELTNSLAMADTFVGTSTYMSPERIQGLNYGVKSDVWSMGLMLIELANGVPVWSDDEAGQTGGPEGILDLLQRIVNETPPSLTGKINNVTKQKFDPLLCQFIDSSLIKDDSLRKSPQELLDDKDGFLKGVEEGVFEKDVKSWAKKIRRLHKEKMEDK